jgi:hypothetical protein
MSRRLVLWRWIVFGVIMAPFLYQALYPRWHCVTGSALYMVHPSVLANKPPPADEGGGYPPDEPMARCPRVRRTVVRAPLFAPPRQIDGRPCRAELDWETARPWLLWGGVTAYVMLFVLAKTGERPCTDPGFHSS